MVDIILFHFFIVLDTDQNDLFFNDPFGNDEPWIYIILTDNMSRQIRP